MAQWNEQLQEVVKVIEVSPSQAIVRDKRGNKFPISFISGVMAAPKVGELWCAERNASKAWSFKFKLDSTPVSPSKFGIVIDPVSCIGMPDAVVRSIPEFDEVWLKVAQDGKVYWESDVATDYKLTLGPDVLSEVKEQCRRAGKKLIACFGMDVWNSSNSDHQPYLQQSYSSGTMPDITTAYEGGFSPVLAKAPIISLVSEIVNTVDGIAFLSPQYGGSDCDYNKTVISDYHRDKGVYPPVAVDATADAFWAWQEYREGLWEDFFATVKATVPSNTELICVLPAWGVGRVITGIGDDFASAVTVTSIGVDLSDSSSLTGDTDVAKVENAELELAVVNRNAGISKNRIAVLDSILATSAIDLFIKRAMVNGIRRVVLSDYDGLVGRSGADRGAITSSIDKSRTEAESQAPSVAILCSSDTIDIYPTSSHGSVSLCCADIVKHTGMRVEAMFDADVEDMKSQARTIVLLDTRSMSTKALDSIKEWVNRQDKSLAAMGLVGYNGTTPPLWSWFGAVYQTTATSSVDLKLADDAPVVPNKSYGTHAWNTQTVTLADNKLTEASVPLLVGANSVVLGVQDYALLSDLFWRLVAFSASR